MRKITYYMTDENFHAMIAWQREVEIQTGNRPGQQAALNMLLELGLQTSWSVMCEDEDKDAATQHVKVLTFLAKRTGTTRRCGTV